MHRSLYIFYNYASVSFVSEGRRGVCVDGCIGGGKEMSVGDCIVNNGGRKRGVRMCGVDYMVNIGGGE